MQEAGHTSLATVLADPATSRWLRNALISATQRDPLDAAHDAVTLARVLEHRVDAMLDCAARQVGS